MLMPYVPPSVDPQPSTSVAWGMWSSRRRFVSALHATPAEHTTLTLDVS